MAAERPRSAIDIGSQGMDLSSPEKEGPVSPDGPSKKKKFAPLKSLKRFFAGTKKKKAKDDVTGVGLKSTSCDELESKKPGAGQLVGSNLMSMSADSVFSGDRPRDANIEFTRSMEVIPGHNFKDELARKLHGRRSDDDEGLPSSPPSHLSTVDALIENGLHEKSRSMDSEHSLMSMDSSEAELDEDFFRKDWASSSGHLAESPTVQNDLDLDLDVVASTSSLNISAAKHKIAVKPKTKGRSAGHAQRRRTTSPKPSGGVMVLPKLKEESSLTEVPMYTEEEEANSSHEKLESTDDEIEIDLKSHQLKSDQSDDQKEDDPEVQEMSIDFSDKTGASSDDEWKDSPREVIEETPPREKSPSPTVVLRKKDSLLKADSAKRSTIAGDNVEVKEVKEVTRFGERKVKRSSLVMEGRNWDELGKSKEKESEAESPEAVGSEFANVFAKFRKNASQKNTDVDPKASEGKKGISVFKSEQTKHSPAVKKVSDGNVTLGFNVQNKASSIKPSHTVLDTKNKQVVIEKKESNEIKSKKKKVPTATLR